MDSQYETTPSPITTQGFFAPQGPAPTTTAGTTTTTSATATVTSEDAYKAYEQKNEELLKGINFEKLAKLIDDCKKGVEAGKDKDLILLVGRTGAGKSTTLNYLMGCPLKSVRKGMKSFLDVADGKKPFAEIGHDLTKSKTLYPQVLPIAESPQLAYVDLPGIGDTRILEEELCASVAFPMALHSARSVKGIILVIDANDLTTGRGEAFVDLLKILGNLFKNSAFFDPMNASNQMLFVFTKVPMDCGLKEILETVKDAKNELMETSQKYQKELNEATEQLAFHVNVLSEWKKVSNKENTSEDKFKLQMKILEIASQKPFSEKPEIQNIQARCKILGEEVQNTFAQLMGLEFILKHADKPDNLFIIRGNEKDDKAKLLNSIAALQHAPPIPKEDFDLNGNKNGEWVTLDKVIQKIAAEGAMLLSTQSAYDAEVSTLKKYKKLVEKQWVEQEELLKKLKTSKLSREELEKLSGEVLNQNKTLIEYQTKCKEKKQAEKAEMEKELMCLDVAEPLRYRHRDLEPVVFKGSFAKDIAIPLSILLLTPILIPTVAGILLAWAGGVIGVVSAGVAKILQKAELISNETVKKAFLAPLIPGSLLMLPFFLAQKKALSVSHHFKYEDIPFIKVKRVPSDTTRDSSYSSSSDELVKKLDEFFMEVTGFDLSTEVNNPAQGKYEIVYKNNIGGKDEITAWIEIFVEKRIHPEIKPRIDIIKKILENFDLTMSAYLEYNLKQLSDTMEEEKKFLAITSNEKERQAALIQILEKRESQHGNRMTALRGVILGYQTTAHENYREFSKKNIVYISMLKQLVEIIGTNDFVQKFIADCESFMVQKNIKSVNTVWGRKQNPDQQPEYKIESAKFEPGCSIIAFFKPKDKLQSIGWFGKIGCMPGSLDINQQLPDASRARRDSAGESMKEKIAADLYDYLGNDNYIVPKTRLAELPIKNSFTEKHHYTPILLSDINKGRKKEEEIDEGVYVMSKKIQDYQDLVHLKDCVLGDLKLDFLEFLNNGKIPEEVMVEGKKVPLNGIMEILAVSRLLADTDVLGGGGKNSGFVVERDMKGEPVAVRAVKIDPGNAFNFRGVDNKFYQSLHPAASSASTLQDKHDLQYGNMQKPILWKNLTESQQKQFIQALDKGLSDLRNSEKILSIIEREAFKQTPKIRTLPSVKEHLADLEENLKWQEETYGKELVELRKSSFSSYSM